MSFSTVEVAGIPGWPGDIEAGSILDFSSMLDGPAGKYGRLITKDGKFVFKEASDKPVRFYGVNLSFGANYLDKESCRKLTDRFAASGYNSVRIHHHDRPLAQNTDLRATDPDPVAMDKLDYLFHCCKERGIYITTDLYVSRIPKEIFPELGRPVKNFEEFKFLIHLLDDVWKNWEDFARNFLEHVNPYTGIAWKDDPALVTLSMVNEDAIYHCYKNANPDIRTIYDRHFEAWLAERKLTPESPERKTALLNLFLFETCRDSFARMRAFIRSLGCKTLLTDQNHWSIIPMSLLRQPCDYVDDHFYWDHPEGFGFPSRMLNTSCLSDLSLIFSGIFPGRCFGKPYTISEFNWVYPNQFRAEGAAIAAAYAALQDWDGLYRYSYSHSDKVMSDTLPAHFFDIAADPINLLSERIGVLLFLREDVKRSDVKIPFGVSSGHMREKNPRNTYPDEAWKLGFVGQIGTVVEKDGRLDLPPATKACIGVGDEIELNPDEMQAEFLVPKNDAELVDALNERRVFGAGKIDLHGGLIRSSTGELEIHEKAGTFQVSTPRSEVMVFNQPGSLAGPVVTISSESGPATISISSMDDKPLEDSRRILLIHLTNALRTDTRFTGNIVEQMGTATGFIVSRNRAEITFRFCNSGETPRIWALDLAGKRIHEINYSQPDAWALSFMADTLANGTPEFLYEILR